MNHLKITDHSQIDCEMLSDVETESVPVLPTLTKKMGSKKGLKINAD